MNLHKFSILVGTLIYIVYLHKTQQSQGCEPVSTTQE